jgi:negative regulator of flagellin synthesis FlgM
MADKISGYGRGGIDVGSTRARGVDRVEREASTTGADRARTTGDAVQITDTAAKLKVIEARLAEVPDVDQARVAAIRERIESGNYQPDPARIAQKLLRMEQDLG